jgi:uncharacterized membrane protein YsdA (DUF1294 family)
MFDLNPQGLDWNARILLAAAVVYALLSVLTAAVYWMDKRHAVNGARRIPERDLHTLELLGGWPGALIAQHVFRHKNRQRSFFIVTWLIAALHVAAWLLLRFVAA